MDAAQKIREAVDQVSARRQRCMADPLLASAVAQVKRFQARRFAATYADLLATGPFRAAAQFFLDELYGDQDFSQRDQQFARIAGALQRIFPKEAAVTAVALAELHALTEQLDFEMAQAWLGAAFPEGSSEASRYASCWRSVARRDDRTEQLEWVLKLGRELEKLTRAPGLRLLLRMMRGPAAAAGLGDLQRFLESGFETFSALASEKGLTAEFLGIIEQRESHWMQQLFDADPLVCAAELESALGQAR